MENIDNLSESQTYNEDIINVPFESRLKDTLSTLFVEELPEEGRRFRKASAFALGLTTQIVDRGRAMVFALPLAFDSVLQYSDEKNLNTIQTGTAAGFAVGSIFAAWSYVVGKSFQISINEFPKTTDKVIDNHPAMVGVISRAIGGFPSKDKIRNNHPIKPDDGYKIGPYESRDSVAGKIGVGISRGLKTGLLYGTTAQVGMAKVNEYSQDSSNKIRRAATYESSLLLGGLASTFAILLKNDLLAGGDEVREVITNSNYLAAASAFFIVNAAISNYISRKKFIENEKIIEANNE